MHTLIHNLLAVHLAICFAFDFVLKLVRNLLHMLVDRIMDALGINALLELISRTKRMLTLIAAISFFLFVFVIGASLPIRRA
jgi:hypothetical protein